MKSIKTYILHYKPLEERKKFLISKLDSEYINYEFIEEFDQEELSLEKINKDYIYSEKIWLNKLKYLEVEGIGSFRKLTNAEISLIYKHIKALEIISKSKSEYELILEDDVVPVARYKKKLKNIIEKFKRKKIRTSLFINPSIKDIALSKELNVDCVEIHTGKISNIVKAKKKYTNELNRIKKCSILANKLNIEVHAGHGLDYKTTKILNKIKEIEEFNIGHFIIGESIFFGLSSVIKKFRKIINN